MKVRCINTGDIKNIQNNKIYSVAFLTKTNVKLLDPYARSNYSIKRFSIIDEDKEILLSEYIDKFKSLPKNAYIYKSPRINYDFLKKGYLISFRHKIKGVKEDDIFEYRTFTKNYFGRTVVTMYNIVTNYRIDVEFPDISRNFYNIEEWEVLGKMRREKIQRIKSKYENSKNRI